MKRTQILIIFVVAIFGAVFAQGNVSTVTESVTSTGTSPSFTGVTETTADNVTTPGPITTAPVEPTTTAKLNGSTTAAPPVISTTTIGPTVAPTSTAPAATTTTTNVTTVASTTPTVTTEEQTTHPCVPSGFDGASFIGGIVLALGVIVILVIIVKCYNHQSRKNELHYSQF